MKKMAAPTKRSCDPTDNEISQKSSTSEAKNEDLVIFLKWCNQNNFNLNEKVKVSREGSCAQYGLIAVQDIEEGECLFQIPRGCLLNPDNTSIPDTTKCEMRNIKSESGWVPLLISLMYEYNNPSSVWRPYLDLVPDLKELDLPLFWTKSERDTLLQGTGLPAKIDKDLMMMTKEFKELVLPFVTKHAEVFSEACQNFDLYKKMVAFVMAYSFTEPLKDPGEDDIVDDDMIGTSPPMMVPMADILNHVSKNNAKLMFEKEALKMVSVCPIKKGQEVYNTYGLLDNWRLLQMYGFAEIYPENQFDSVEMPMEALLEVTKKIPDISDKELLEEKWSFLNESELVTEDGSFVLGLQGFETDIELYDTLRVLVMDREGFTDHKDKDGFWSDDEEFEQNDVLSFENISTLSSTMKKIIRGYGQHCLSCYETSLEEDEQLIQSNKHYELPSRHKYAFYTKYGQKKILHKLLVACG